MKRKDFFNGNVKSPRGFWGMLIGMSVLFLVCALFLLFMGLFYNNMADGDRLAYIVIGAVWISLTVIFFVLSILLARA